MVHLIIKYYVKTNFHILGHFLYLLAEAYWLNSGVNLQVVPVDLKVHYQQMNFLYEKFQLTLYTHLSICNHK